MERDVFISYSHKDKAVADAICAKLEKHGIRCWYAPRDIVPGADWAASIVEAIKSVKVMILIFTDYSNSSQQVLREVNTAVANGVVIVPFKLTETLPSEGMEYYLSTVHWLDAMNRPLERSIAQLDVLVSSLLTGSEIPIDREPIVTPPPRPRWLIPAIALAIAALVGLGAFLGPRLMGGGAGESGSEAAPSGSGTLETIAIPTSGNAQVSNPENSGAQGNLQCNYQNGGYATSDGEWFYYRSNDRMSIYKMRLDGSEKTKLNDQQSSYIGVIDGYVYYYASGGNSGVWRMKTDGSQQTCIYSGTLEDMCIVDGRIYFKNSLDGLKLYSMELDGTDVHREGDLDHLYYLAFWDGKMYWSNQDDGGTLYRANYDGSEATRLTDNAVDTVRIADGWVFYNDLGDYHSYLMNAETLETYEVLFDGIYGTTISSWGIIGGSSSNNLKLYRNDLGSKAMNPVLDIKAENVSVAEGYLFYYNEDDRQVYMVDVYGENNQVL